MNSGNKTTINKTEKQFQMMLTAQFNSARSTIFCDTSSYNKFFTYFFAELIRCKIFFAVSCMNNFQQLQFNKTLYNLYAVSFWQPANNKSFEWNVLQLLMLYCSNSFPLFTPCLKKLDHFYFSINSANTDQFS